MVLTPVVDVAEVDAIEIIQKAVLELLRRLFIARLTALHSATYDIQYNSAVRGTTHDTHTNTYYVACVRGALPQ